MNWFECKVRYERTVENGMLKKVTESYLVDALSFTEAEARIIKEITPFMSGEFTIANVRRYPLAEMFLDETGDKWYRCKVCFITIDERTGTEKETASFMLSQAADFESALANLIDGMKGTMADYRILEIKETAIVDLFPYEKSDEETPENGQPEDEKTE